MNGRQSAHNNFNNFTTNAACKLVVLVCGNQTSQLLCLRQYILLIFASLFWRLARHLIGGFAGASFANANWLPPFANPIQFGKSNSAIWLPIEWMAGNSQIQAIAIADLLNWMVILLLLSALRLWLLARNKNWLHSFMNSTNCLFAAANIINNDFIIYDLSFHSSMIDLPFGFRHCSAFAKMQAMKCGNGKYKIIDWMAIILFQEYIFCCVTNRSIQLNFAVLFCFHCFQQCNCFAMVCQQN